MPQLIGTAPNQVPTNGDLGTAAYMDTSAFYGAASSPSFRNRIINGAMVIDQRSAGASVTTSVLQTGVYTVDRWSYYNDVVSKRTIQQSSVAPPGFKNSLKVTVIATDTSGPQQFIRQPIEGYNTQDLNWGTANAQPAVLSFWVRSSVVGQHGGALQNNNTDQVYPIAYTINVADTWEYKTINIPGPTSGTWPSTTGLWGSVQFEHGPGYQKAPANVWIAQNATSSTGSVNLCATNGATWYITGVQFEKGTVATPFEHRPIGTELQLCQRYYEKSYDIDTVPGNSSVNNNQGVVIFRGSGVGSRDYVPIYFKQTKRTAPTVTIYSPTGASGFYRDVETPTDLAAQVNGGGTSMTTMQSNSTATVNKQCGFLWTASAEF